MYSSTKLEKAFKGAEITLEIDPASFTEQNLQEYAAIGINRLSLGAQSFDDDVLIETIENEDDGDSDIDFDEEDVDVADDDDTSIIQDDIGDQDELLPSLDDKDDLFNDAASIVVKVSSVDCVTNITSLFAELSGSITKK